MTVPPVDLIALDVDGTVLTPDGSIAPSTRDAVAAARKGGVRVLLASSRGPIALERIQARLGLRDEWFIGFQGALVGRRTDDGLDVLAETRIPDSAAREVESRALALNLSIGRYAGLEWHVPVLTEVIRREAAATGEHPIERAVEAPGPGSSPHKLAAIAAGEHQSGALRTLAGQLPAEVTGTLSHPLFLEITAAGVDKGSGLRALAAHLGVSPARTAAVGDGPNDLGLFAAVERSIAMGQATAEVRGAAGWTTTSNSADGVARALAHLGVAGPFRG